VLDPQDFINALDDYGISFYAGVPCSFLKGPMSLLANRKNYVGAAIETDALAMCAGAWFAGKKTAVFCQNSGLGNLISPLSSLNEPFAIPTLLVIGWRGKPGNTDEPQHRLMGETTQQILAAMNIVSFELPKTTPEAKHTLDEAFALMAQSGKSAALLVSPKTFETASAPTPPVNKKAPTIGHKTLVSDVKTGTDYPNRYDFLKALSIRLPENIAVIATTGKCGRELYSIDDKTQHFYMVGSMGSASAIGLGAALNTTRTIVVLDGDGAALMRLGTMATVGRVGPPNLVHIILDNQAHDSTGGQPTGSEAINFSAVAAACGYASATSCDNVSAAIETLEKCLAGSGPHLLHIRIKPGSLTGLGRPAPQPHDVARRFQAFLKSHPLR